MALSLLLRHHFLNNKKWFCGNVAYVYVLQNLISMYNSFQRSMGSLINAFSPCDDMSRLFSNEVYPDLTAPQKLSNKGILYLLMYEQRINNFLPVHTIVLQV